jgi:hypothetical protein
LRDTRNPKSGLCDQCHDILVQWELYLVYLEFPAMW